MFVISKNGFELINFNILPVDHPSISPRIVGGHDAFDAQAPFICSLQRKRVHICGCVILSKEYVLTAAHCFMK